MDNRTEHNLLENALARVRRLGIEIEIAQLEPVLDGRHIDALVRIGQGRQARTYVAEVKKGLRPATLGATLHQLEGTGKPPLLIADYVTPPLAEALRERGVAFLDTAGNAFVNQPPLFLWVKGERPREKPTAKEGTGRAFQASGLKVLFALLCHPDWVGQPYREIATLAGVAHGTVGWVMAELPRLGYVADVAGRRRLLQPELLLKQWAEAYARTLRPKLAIGRYRTDKQQWWTKLQPHKYQVLLGGEPAAERVTKYLRPETVTLYGEKAEPRLLLDYKLRQDPGGPVEILKRFWKFEIDDKNIAPLPLIYADLLFIGDARCLETAELIYQKIADGFVQ
ncbi:MAG: type IV toxin-antitoxin system AbiEi family antitoxin [Gammaproteobacteria bacterium]|nr:type IV toxin-antitoxin system AbiEi family antitoxin [Gammaproteobacteria bacterium]